VIPHSDLRVEGAGFRAEGLGFRDLLKRFDDISHALPSSESIHSMNAFFQEFRAPSLGCIERLKQFERCLYLCVTFVSPRIHLRD